MRPGSAGRICVCVQRVWPAGAGERRGSLPAHLCVCPRCRGCVCGCVWVRGVFAWRCVPWHLCVWLGCWCFSLRGCLDVAPRVSPGASLRLGCARLRGCVARCEAAGACVWLCVCVSGCTCV